MPGVPLPAQGRIRPALRRISRSRRAVSPSAIADRHRRGAAGRSQQSGYLGADRLEDISKLDQYSEGDPRVLELNGALNVGNRGLVEFIEVFKNETEYLHCDDHGDAGKGHPGARPPRDGLRRYLHPRALQRGRVAEIQGRPHQRSDPRSYRRDQGAIQSAAVRGSQDLPEDHSQLGLPRPCRAAHARVRLDVRDSVAPGADLQVRPDDQAAAVQRRRGRRERTDQEDRRGGAEGRRQARRACRESRPASS